MLLSFERPAARRALCAVLFCEPGRTLEAAVRPLCRTLKTAQLAELGIEVPGSNGYHRAPRTRASPFEAARVPLGSDHRQDSKGTRWMPWHQESMKGVDDCDKPR